MDSNQHIDQITINNLPENCIELIFANVNLYEDFNTLRVVSRRWNKLANNTLRRIKRHFYKCTSFSWRFVDGDHLLSERCSHSSCFHPRESVFYMFGGCTNTYTAFNDLWIFELNSHEWERVIITRPSLPSPKALATLSLYRDNLLLFGGFSKSSMNPIHQTSTFYNELHLFNTKTNCWEEIVSENTAPHLAGHTCSIVSNFMLVFGGSMGSCYNNNVYVLDLNRRIWNMPTIPGPCPPPRYGQSQILLDDRHLVIIGGCGGPSVMFSDVWLLEFDLYGDAEWQWTQTKIENPELTPPYTWCHRACKVGQNAVFVSRPIRYNISPRRKLHGRMIYRRRTSSQSTNSSAGGNGRLASPDSPSDKRAVAAAFCSSSTESLQQQQYQKGKNGQSRDGKPILLTSRSLDEHDHRATNSSAVASDQANQKKNTSLEGTIKLNSLNVLSCQKNGELHRACSIPAIIVGEIPKLIVTSTIESVSNNVKSAVNQPPPAFNKNCQQRICHASTSIVQPESPLYTTKPNMASKRQISQSDNKLFIKENLDEPEKSLSDSNRELHEYYLSLLREEYNRLRVIEFAENLHDLNLRMDQFLRVNIPYLSVNERLDIVKQFFLRLINNGSDNSTRTDSSKQSGSIKDLHHAQRNLFSNSYSHLNTGKGQASSSEENTDTSLSMKNLGLSYSRRLCVYVLRLSNVTKEHRVIWEQLPVEEDAPEDKILHSLVACHGEIILFGGMNSDGSGMDCLNVGMERHTMSADTFIIRPNYNEM